jgi:adenine-specific DNA-methyltransferase
MPTLDWIGKKAVVDHHRQVPYHLLRCDPALSVGEAGSGNLLVEGDNLLALKALLPYYAGQVKCIYIDPPYNTGNENWVYNDAVNSPEMRAWLGRTVGGASEDLSRHDKWLCMMYPRLALLRQFLRADGSIWISLDDNEMGNARLILDEIFGGRNFVATVIWQKMYSPKSSARFLSVEHDYVIVYARDADRWTPNLLPRGDEQNGRYNNPDNDPRGPWKPGGLDARNPYSLGRYPITTPSGRRIEGPPKGAYWRVSEQKLGELDADNRIWWGKNGGNVPAIKRFLSEVKQGIVAETIWPYNEVGHTQEAKKEIVSILPDAQDVFITPKPTRLIQRVLHLATDVDALVMDAFAGSGTTGQAVLATNAQDNGKRRFILVEMDPVISHDITRERLARVIDGYGGTDGKPVAGLGGGFRYCRLGQPLFDERGRISREVTFGALAHHVYFTETGEPLPGPVEGHGPLLGVAGEVAYYLLFNGGRRNVLDAAALATMPPHKGPRVVYADGCRLSRSELDRLGVTFKQIPYQIRTT